MEFKPESLFAEYKPIENRVVRPESEFNTHKHNIYLTLKTLLKLKNGFEQEPTKEQLATINKLSEWLVGKYKPQSGILLSGSVGTGKTTLMQAFLKYYCFVYNKIINEFHAKTLPSEYKKRDEGIAYFYKRPIFIDDLGKESAITADYGQKYDTWGDLFSIRYEKKALTFATANYKIETGFKDIYGDVIADRMKEHFNVFEMMGESLRK